MDPSSQPHTEHTTRLGTIKPLRESAWRRVRRVLLGNPIASEHTEHALLNKRLALPVFASDAISSVAYATQQIVLYLGAAGLWLVENREQYTHYTMLISALIVALLIIVVISYTQTIYAYPSGGGSYIVSKDNLGTLPGLMAGAALLIDYILTVAVSIASGVQNLASMPLLGPLNVGAHLVLWSLFCIAVLTFANLRGLRESGATFAVFTYGFVLCAYSMIIIGLLGPLFGWVFHREEILQVARNWPTTVDAARAAASRFSVVVLLGAFANGCSAMTGTEAVSNGIPAFRQPRSRNAAVTLIMMGVILGTVFLGISAVAMRLHVVYYEAGIRTAPAVIDQISGAIFGKSYAQTGLWFVGYYLTQFFTAMILVIAANTSYADFPRLMSILANDRFAPKQFANLGDKLTFNNGILILAVLAGLLIVVKRGSVDSLIPLYAIGVFFAFTLSQSGMVVHWRRLRDRGWLRRAVINGIGATATGIVLLDIAAEKFREGAWMVVLLLPVLVALSMKIHRHYKDVAFQLRARDYAAPATSPTNTVLVLVSNLHRGVLQALEYARSISTDCRAIHIATDPEKVGILKTRWEEFAPDVPLVILSSPYRSLTQPILQYLDAVEVERRNHIVTLVIPEFVATRKWHNLLHGHSGLKLKLALLNRRNVVVANVRYWLRDTEDMPPDTILQEEEGHHTAGHAGAVDK